jgi:hypothetical protein
MHSKKQTESNHKSHEEHEEKNDKESCWSQIRPKSALRDPFYDRQEHGQNKPLPKNFVTFVFFVVR